MPSIGVRLAATTDAQLDCVWLAVYFWAKVSRIKRLYLRKARVRCLLGFRRSCMNVF